MGAGPLPAVAVGCDVRAVHRAGVTPGDRVPLGSRLPPVRAGDDSGSHARTPAAVAGIHGWTFGFLTLIALCIGRIRRLNDLADTLEAEDPDRDRLRLWRRDWRRLSAECERIRHTIEAEIENGRKVVLHPNGTNGSSHRASTSKRGSRSAGDGSSHQTLEELRREAKAQGVEGRSHMNKQQLEQALTP
ncbi:hypothetical protein Snoj_34380 [Streptomyces nojiriensis]|uniref:Rho termination factor N-terminal domain-containing protein n=1 Tax=Streptomyces nojiriensis TaxID=66374 RepID=A0ABQ3SN10_9ACTN|nr:hypothetical protein [Streptomyces nojiriensis]GGS30810.1 hypothetical protein GCM10010205_71290 [Streptomyces nojiriensis]GHI69520.1 hypothetical protein Snoj_34380 [Streptomyces nojiriensis]